MTNETRIQLNEQYHVIQIRTRERVQLSFYKDNRHFHDEFIGVQYPELNLECEHLSWLSCILGRLTPFPELVALILSQNQIETAVFTFGDRTKEQDWLARFEPYGPLLWDEPTPIQFNEFKIGSYWVATLVKNQNQTLPLEAIMPYDQYREAFAQVFGADALPKDGPNAVDKYWKQVPITTLYPNVLEQTLRKDGLSDETIEAIESLVQGWPLAFWL